MEKSYTLTFGGYWLEPNISGLPASSGIYGVYACIYDKSTNTVALNRILYIGESSNINGRIAGHEKWDKWRRHLKTGEQICFNAALISGESDRQRAEAAMIFEHKPPCNEEFVKSFPYHKTTITTRDKNDLMRPHFTVYPT